MYDASTHWRPNGVNTSSEMSTTVVNMMFVPTQKTTTFVNSNKLSMSSKGNVVYYFVFISYSFFV